ncbi:MAG: prephenate dehydratase [Syntrophomonadaceae bacterium]|nr:prephenate dehydratase [Syntrophomonadaceae bacterium]
MSRIAVLGPPGTYSEEAARSCWPDSRDFMFASDISEVFAMVVKGQADEGLVPIFNSCSGSIGKTMRGLINHDVYITGQLILPVRHCLMAREPLRIEEIEVIISQPEALLQCENYMTQQVRGARKEIVLSTGQAAVFVKQEKRKAAAIGSRNAAGFYGLQIIAEGLEDDKENCTTFINIKREHLTKGNKITVLFGVKDSPGTLYQALETFARRGINLTKLESRPGGFPAGGYIFYVDIEGGAGEPEINEALQELSGQAAFFKYLGSYS